MPKTIGYLKQEHKLDYGALKCPLTLPAGMRVAFFPDPSGGRWCVDEFPLEIFPGYSIERWDAIHQGVTVPNELVTDSKPQPKDA